MIMTTRKLLGAVLGCALVGGAVWFCSKRDICLLAIASPSRGATRGVSSERDATDNATISHEKSSKSHPTAAFIHLSHAEAREKYQMLSKVYSGRALVEEQRKFIAKIYCQLDTVDVLPFLQDVLASSADEVCRSASQYLGEQFFSGDPRTCVEALKEVHLPPSLLALFCDCGAHEIEDVALFLNDKGLREDAKKSLARSWAFSHLIKGTVDAATADIMFEQVQNGRISERDLEGSMNLARLGVDFQHIANTYASDVGTGLRSAIYRAWARNSPQECVQAVLSKQTSDETRDLIGPVVTGWCSSSPQEAAAWVNDLKDWQVRDQGAAAVASSLVDLSPEESITWALSIQDKQIRQNTLSKLNVLISKSLGENSARAMLESALPADEFNTVTKPNGKH